MITHTQPKTTLIAGRPFPIREGEVTATVGPSPHRQESEKADPALVDQLIANINALDGVTVSTRGGFVGRGFMSRHAYNWSAHIHHYEDGDHQDGSMHIEMPQEVSAQLETIGWGVRHPAYPAMLLVFCPRNESEVKTITNIVELSKLMVIRMLSKSFRKFLMLTTEYGEA